MQVTSLAGVCPGRRESAGKRRSGKTRHGNRWLVGALGIAAMAAVRTRDTTYLGACYPRLGYRLGKKKALRRLAEGHPQVLIIALFNFP